MLVIRLIACTFLFITPSLLAKPFPAERIISLAPHATEIAYAAGLGDKLVAVSEYSDYPPQALELERVANHQTINIEKILTLKPDLIIAWPAAIHRVNWPNCANSVLRFTIHKPKHWMKLPIISKH